MRLFVIATFFVPFLLAEDQIGCHQCEYVYEIDEDRIIGITGESWCRDGPLPDSTKKLYDVKTIKGSQNYITRCGVVHSIGTETVHDGMRETVKQFHSFERKGYKISENSNIKDYNGDIALTETGYFCGANRTECSGDVTSGMLSQTCQKAKPEAVPNGQCDCPRCEWKQTSNDANGGQMINVLGSPDCERGTSNDMWTCVQGMGPEKNKRSSRAGGEIGGTCYTWKEIYAAQGKTEMINFIRTCDVQDARPLNEWSSVQLSTTNMTLCDNDYCNSDNSSSILHGPVIILLLFTQYFI